MTEETKLPTDEKVNQKQVDQNALSELEAYLPGCVESFEKKVAGDPALQEKVREVAKNNDRSATMYLLLNSDGPGFKEHIADIFKNTSWGARNETVVIESISSIMNKRNQAKNEYIANRVDRLINKAA